MITKIPQTARNLNRFRVILQVIVKHGFGDVVSQLGLDSLLHEITFKLRRKTPEIRTEVRFRLAIEELGATFIKLGQILATRPDVIPLATIVELRKLQDDVPAVPSKDILALLEEEFGRPPSEVFASFDESALAAASIGQVHRARLTSGEEVVLKIQRPGLEQLIETDLSIMRWVAELMLERLPELARYDPVGLVNEFERSLLKEIDFLREAQHMKRFARNFAGDERVYVPKVYDDWTTRRVLCEEFIQGKKADSPDITDLPLERRKVIATNGIHCILTQVFVHGFFHADPHPGNIFIVNGDQSCFIDYGMMGILDQDRIDELLSFMIAILTRDAEAIVRLFAKLELIDEETNERAIRLDLLDLLERYGSFELGRLDIGQIIADVFDVLTRYNVRIPADLLLVGKALATIDGVARALYPELDPLEAIRGPLLEIYLERLTDPRRVSRYTKRVLMQTWDLIETLPKDVRLTLRKLRTGEIRHNLSLVELTPVLATFERSINRVFLALIVSGLTIGASNLLASSDVAVPAIGTPLNVLAGIVFLALSVLYGVVLFIGIIRTGGV